MPSPAPPPATPPRTAVRPWATVCAAALTLACAGATPPPAPPSPPGPEPTLADHELRDRVVAVVDEEAILLSDVEELVGLGLVERRPGESDQALRERALEGLIEQRLRYQAAERFGFGRVSVEEIEAQVRAVAARFDSRAAFRERLAAVGMSEEELRQLLARQLMVLNYVDERLGARVFVSLDDIRAYYQDELVPRLQEAGQEAPPLDEVREEIRGLLKERRLDDEVARWTAELRREADVLTFLDEPLEELPPLRIRRTEPVSDG